MAEFYPWFVVAHLVGLVLFAVSHGASAFMAFRVRGERDPVVVDSLPHAPPGRQHLDRKSTRLNSSHT